MNKVKWQANVCLQLLIILLIHLNSSLHGSCSMRKKVIIHVRILEELREHGDESLLVTEPIVRSRNDTCPWKR